jgi:glycosyltransferase involved in cell wall biosynthesis
MRVLMLNRPDVSSVPGGDTVQMLRTKAALERLGIEVTTGHAGDINSSPPYDIVHIFNWQWLGPILAQWPSSGALPRLVLSPIFWYHTGHWFDQASSSKRLWKSARRILGYRRACRLYEAWQQEKFCWGKEGRELRRLFDVPDQFLPNSMMESSHLEAVLALRGRLGSRTTVVPNGIDREMFDPMPQPDRKFFEEYRLKDFVVQVARIQSAKNQLGLIEALFDVPVPLVFIGQPSPYEEEYVSSCCERARQRGNVYFLGPRAPGELFGIVALAAVHALPSWRETPGLASLEAAAAGCRIVTTSIGSAREYFGMDAWYCDPRDPLTIREAVLQALNSPPSSTLRERVLQNYTWDEAAKATYQAYCKALEKK